MTNERPYSPPIDQSEAECPPPQDLLIGNTETEDTRLLELVGQHSGPYLHNVHNVSSETRLMSMFVTPAQGVMAQVASGSVQCCFF